MTGLFEKRLFQAKSILCIMVLLGMHVFVGCGTPTSLLTFGGQRISLVPGHPLTQSLAGSVFEGATAVEINQTTGRFRFIFPDDSREISGVVSFVDGKAQMRQITVQQGANMVSLSFNDSHQIAHILSADGSVWQRPAGSNANAREVSGDGNPYVAANGDLLEMARQYDASGGATAGGASGSSGSARQPGTTPGGVKINQSLFPLVPFLAAFVFYPASVLGTILFLLEVVFVVTVIF